MRLSQYRYWGAAGGVLPICLGRLYPGFGHKLALKILYPAFGQELLLKIKHDPHHLPVTLDRFKSIFVALFFVTELPLEVVRAELHLRA